MKKPTRILIVEDLAADAELAEREIRKVFKDCAFQVVETHKDFLKALETFQPDVILSDYALPHFDGITALKLALQHTPLTPLIIWTGSSNEDIAVDCMKAGANNYVLKDNLKRLGPAVLRALEEKALLVASKQAEEALQNNEKRYRALFEDLPISIWEEDYSEVKELLDSLKQQGIADFRKYFATHPDAVIECADRIRVLGVNNATLKMHHADNKDDLLKKINQGLGKTQLEYLQEAFISIAEGKTGFVWEGTDETMAGEPIEISIAASITPGYERDLSKVIVAITDITERKCAEEALQNSEKRFRALIENGLDNISLLSADGTLLWESPSSMRTLNYPLNEHLGVNIFEELMHPDDLQWTRDLFAKLVREPGSRDHAQFRLRHADGTWHWVEAVVTNMLNEPSINAIVANYRDVNEQKQAEEELHKSQTKYRNLVETSHDLIWSVDAEGKFTFVNRAAREIYGYEPEELIGRSFFEIMDPEHYDLDSTEFKEAIAAIDERRDVESYVRHRDGRKRILSANSMVVRDSGEVIGVTGSSRDITERKHVEGRMNDLLAFNDKILNYSPIGIITYKFTGECVFANENAAAIVGANVEQLRAQNFKTIESWKKSGLYDLVEKAITTQAPGTADIHHVSTFGKDVWMTVRCVTFKSKGEDHVLLSISDITERKLADIELQQKNDDLGLLNAINEAVVQGQNLDSVIELLAKELNRIFSTQGNAIYSTIYMLTPDKRYVRMQKYFFPSEIARRIEKLLGFSIPIIESPVKDGGHFHKALTSGRSVITSEPKAIQDWITDFAETKFLPPLARAVARKFIPQIYKLLNIKAVLAVPLVSEEETIGFLDVSNSSFFTSNDVKRIENIGRQLTAIIQRQQADEKIRRSEEFLQSIQNALSASVAILDETGTIIRVNSAWRRFGEQNGLAHPDSCVGLNYLEICDAATGSHAEEAPVVAQAIRAIIAGQRSEDRIEYSCHSPDVNRWFTLHITKFEAGDHVWVVLAHEDISERKRAEEALRESEEHYRAIFEGVQDAILVESLDGKILMVNEPACEMFGYSREEFLTKTVADIVAEGYTPLTVDGVDSLLSTEPCESVNRRANGELFPIEISGRLQVINGETVLLVVVRDITERKKAEELLQESEDRFSSAFEYASIGMALVSPDGHWLRVNWALCELVGYSKEELSQKTFQDISHPDDLEKDLGYVQQVLVGEIDSYEMEKRYLHKTGNVIWVLLSVSLVRDNEGSPLYFISQIQDITERKQVEAKLRTSESRYRLATQATKDVIWEWTPENNQLIWTENAQLVFGYSPEEIGPSGTWWDEHIHPNDRERVISTLSTLIDTVGGKSVWSDEYRFVLKDGSYAYIDDHAYLERDPAGRTIRMIGAMSNITSRKQVEAAEREQRALAEALRDTAETLNSTLAYGEVLDHILAAAGRVVPHDAATIMLIDGEIARVVRFRGYEERGFNSDVMKIELPLAETTNLRQMLETGQPVVVSDTRSDPTCKKIRATDWLGSNVGAPISIYGEVVGFIFLDSETSGFFTPVHAERLQAFANQAAIAIHNARLLQQAQEEIAERKRAEEEMRRETEMRVALLETTRDLVIERDLASLLHTIVERAARLLHAEAGGLYLCEPELGQVRCVVSYNTPSDFTGVTLEYGEGAAGMVAQTGEPLIIDNYSAWEGRAKVYSNKDYFRALLTAAIKWQEQVIGVIDILDFREERHFTENDLNILISFANQAAIAIHNARLLQQAQEEIAERKRAEEEIRRRVEEASALLQTSLALTNLDLNVTLETISHSAKSLFAADGCRIFLMEANGESLRCVLALQENAGAFSNLRVKLGEGVTGAVAASGRSEIVNEMQKDPRAIQVPGTPEEEDEAIMFAPLKERDQTIGVLSIRRVGTNRPFRPDDLELLEALASMAASAVSNARLFEEAQRRLTELEALYENGLAVGRLLKPTAIGNRVINIIARYLPWHHVTIRLRREESDDLELVAFSLPNLKEEERTDTEQHFIARINKVGQGLSGWAIQTGTPLRTGNVHKHPQYIDTHAGIQSGLYMPLKVGERVIGVISVESEMPDAFTEQDERLLATLGSQAATAFENARLYQAIEQELSERKRAEEALRTSESHYRELADSITDILFEMDQDLKYTHWNKASELFSGIPAKDAIGKSMQEVWGASEEQAKREAIYRSVLKEQQPRTFEIEIGPKEQKRALEITAYPSTRGVSVVAKDVTDRKRSETIMQKRFELMEYSAHHTLNELMQRTVDEVSELTGSVIGFLHFVREDENTLGMQTWSTNALRLFEVPFGEGAHLPLNKAGVWADAVRERRPLIQNDYASLPQKKGFPRGHVPIVREIVIPIIRNEKIVAVMGIGNKPQDYTPYDLEIAGRLADYAWDITERKQMEVALAEERNQLARRVEERTADLSRANSNLARALRVKDEFLANMSHELRTPLNAILGLSESLGEQIAGPLNEKQQKYITTISESGHHLLSLINDILDLAKIEAGQITLDINKVDIHSVCQASLRMIKQLAQKKNQDVTLTIEEGLGLMWADERRLKQMIVNLLGNAVKFTPENGKIGLEVHGDEEANKVTVTVWDTGIGIKPEDLARLFQPFVQADSGLAREATGTGLGLALVAQMARLHGGSVNAFSEPAVGSRFSIVLPWEPALALDSATRLKITGKFQAIKLDETKKSTILLVEDTKEVVMMLRDYLELAGYKIVTAQDGVDALVQAKLVHPDLILMDIQMPRMDGLEATRRLRDEPDFRYTPIIALTALAMPNDRERCLAAGMDEYVSKPINLKMLVKLIQSYLFRNEEPTPS